MKTLKIIFFSFFIILLIVGTDLISYKIFSENIYKKFNNNQYLSTYYKKEELDKKLPFRHELHGGECVSPGLTLNKMNWHPRIGAKDKSINIDCVNKLFSGNTKNIVFFGGSTMASSNTPNYKTSIEYYMFKNNLNEFRSINLAESGARMSNNLSAFIEYIPKIQNISHIVFLDGYNEILPLKFSNTADNDFYWVAGVKDRLHNPEFFLLKKYLDKSFLKTIFFKNKNLNTKFNLVKKSYEDYLYRKKIITDLCKIYEVKCIFFFQPTIYTSKNLSGNRIKEINKFFLNNNFKKNYKFLYKISKNNSEIIKLDTIFDDKKDIFLDDVHVDKYGNELIGKEIIKYIKN